MKCAYCGKELPEWPYDHHWAALPDYKFCPAEKSRCYLKWRDENWFRWHHSYSKMLTHFPDVLLSNGYPFPYRIISA